MWTIFYLNAQKLYFYKHFQQRICGLNHFSFHYIDILLLRRSFKGEINWKKRRTCTSEEIVFQQKVLFHRIIKHVYNRFFFSIAFDSSDKFRMAHTRPRVTVLQNCETEGLGQRVELPLQELPQCLLTSPSVEQGMIHYPILPVRRHLPAPFPRAPQPDGFQCRRTRGTTRGERDRPFVWRKHALQPLK